MSGSGTCQSGKCLATPDGGVPDAGPDQGADASAEAGTDASSEAGTDAKVEGGAGGDSAVDNGAAADTGAAAEAGAAEAGAGVEAGAAEAGAEAGAAGDGSADSRVGSQDPPPALLWLALVGLIVLRLRR